MMNDIIQTIQQDILNPNISLANILLKAKVLAYQLQNNDFKGWIRHELDGYDEVDDVPLYRVLKVHSLGTFFNGAWRHTRQPIALSTVPPEIRGFVESAHIREGVRALEEFAQQSELHSVWSGDWIAYYNLYNQETLDTYHMVEAFRPILGSRFAQILQTVRSSLQDFILEISDLPWNMSQELPPAAQIERIFQLTINNVNEGGSMSSFDQRGQNVQNQYNAAGDINIGIIQNQTDFVNELQKIKSEVAKAGEAKSLNEDTVIDAEYEITKAIQETKKPEPKKVTILEHIGKAKTLVEGTVATAGLATALMKLIEAAEKLF
jgi:hypothetical protein